MPAVATRCPLAPFSSSKDGPALPLSLLFFPSTRDELGALRSRSPAGGGLRSLSGKVSPAQCRPRTS